jgi:hypothetical protein
LELLLQASFHLKKAKVVLDFVYKYLKIAQGAVIIAEVKAN